MTLYRVLSWLWIHRRSSNTLQHTATHCNTLQHTATHCNTLQYTATHCNTLQHTTTHCNTLQHTATHCNTLQQYTCAENLRFRETSASSRCASAIRSAHCNTVQHTATHTHATHCNTQCNTYCHIPAPKICVSERRAHLHAARARYAAHSSRHADTPPQPVCSEGVRTYVLQGVAVCCSVLQNCVSRHADNPPQPVCIKGVRTYVLQCDAVCCGVLQCVAVCCSNIFLVTLTLYLSLHVLSVSENLCCSVLQ